MPDVLVTSNYPGLRLHRLHGGIPGRAVVWRVDVIDADPQARDKTVRIKIAAPVQPVPPAPAPGVPFRPVVFEGLTLRPWVNSDRCKPVQGRPHRCGGQIAWSIWATGMAAPGRSQAKSES